jgi:hypothetical protein
MMKISTKLIVVIIACLSLSSKAQDSTSAPRRTKEYVISLSNLTPMNIGIGFKKQIRDNKYFRVGLINLSASNTTVVPEPSTSFSTESTSFSAGAEIGFEFRKKLTDNFTVFHGPNVSFTYTTTINRTTNPSIPEDQQKSMSKSYVGSVPYSLGVLVRLKGPFLMSAEIRPAVSYRYSKLDNGLETYTPSVGFTNQYGFISFIYRIPGAYRAIGNPSF